MLQCCLPRRTIQGTIPYSFSEPQRLRAWALDGQDFLSVCVGCARGGEDEDRELEAIPENGNEL